MRQKKDPSRRTLGADESSLLITRCRVWTGNGLKDASILIIDDKIVRVAGDIPRNGRPVLNANGKIALPGMIDPHVHLRDMKLSYKEDFSTGTAAAASGGITTVLDMPNTSPPTDSPQRLRDKIARAKKRIITNVGFHAAAITDPRKIRAMTMMGAFSLKLYMPRPISPLIVDDDAVLLGLFEHSRKVGLPVTVHAEDSHLFTPFLSHGHIGPTTLARKRPEEAETVAVGRALRLAQAKDCRVHLCHLTLPSSIRSVASYSPTASSEVTPHHMLLASKDIRKKGWKAWMVPPLREEKTRHELFDLVLKHHVDIIASDHAPHTIHEKSMEEDPPPGIPGLETTLPLMLTLVNEGRLSLQNLVRLCSTRSAQIFGLPRKGVLLPGFDADVTIVDMKSKGRIRAAEFFSKAKYTPFENARTWGKVHATIVNGTVVFEEEQIVAKPGTGRVLSRDPG